MLNLPKDQNGNTIWPSLFASSPSNTHYAPVPARHVAATAKPTTKAKNIFEQKGLTLKTIIKLEGVTFEDNTSQLKSTSYQRLRVAVVALKKFSKFSVLVAAHTDNKGDEESNKSLSSRRAKVVMEYFINQGVLASRLAFMGYGSAVPIADNSTEEGRLLNTRVELRIY